MRGVLHATGERHGKAIETFKEKEMIPASKGSVTLPKNFGMSGKTKGKDAVAWSIKWAETELDPPIHHVTCKVCGRKATWKKDGKPPFCSKCMAKLFFKLGLKRMKVGKRVPVEKPSKR